MTILLTFSPPFISPLWTIDYGLEAVDYQLSTVDYFEP